MIQNDLTLENKCSAYKNLTEAYRNCYDDCFYRCDKEVILMHQKIDDQLVEAQEKITSLEEEVSSLRGEIPALTQEITDLKNDAMYLRMSKDAIMTLNDRLLASEQDHYQTIERARQENAQLQQDHKMYVAKLTAVMNSYITKMKDQKSEIMQLKKTCATHDHDN
jgi:chromosome segregation ATPase